MSTPFLQDPNNKVEFHPSTWGTMSLESLLRAHEQGVTGALGPNADKLESSPSMNGALQLTSPVYKHWEDKNSSPHSHPYVMKNRSLTNDWVGCLEPRATFTYTYLTAPSLLAILTLL